MTHTDILRDALDRAMDELHLARDFIRIETGHAPTVERISAVMRDLRAARNADIPSC